MKKFIIKKLLAVKIKKYNLFFNNKLLPLNDLIIFSGLKPGDTINLVERNFYVIYLRRGNKNRSFLVTGNDTIELIKIFILIDEGIPIAKQRLSFNAKSLSNNNRKCFDIGLFSGSIFFLKE